MANNQWYVEDGRLTHEDLPAPLSGGYFTPPYPSNFWYVENGRLTHDGLPSPLSGGYFTPPYPNGWWYVEDGRLITSTLPEPFAMGCFSGCTSLKNVVIPVSVNKIWGDSFNGTAIRTVKIADDCTYESDSFPPNCVVERYGA